MKSLVAVKVIGECFISDDLGNTILDKTNTIHYSNLSRAFARGLANEENGCISKIAFGNGGTYFSVAGAHKAKSYNNGVLDKNRYRSRLYNETYSEYVDESNIKISTGLGASQQNDPKGIPNSSAGPGVVSNEVTSPDYKDYSRVVVTCVLNKEEPSGQYLTDLLNNTTEGGGSAFEFDEIGLFTSGVESDIPTSGYQTITFNTPNLYVNTGLMIGKQYSLTIDLDGVEKQYSYAPESTADGTIKFKDLVEQLNKYIPGVTISMDTGANSKDKSNNKYFGLMVFTSKKTGNTSYIRIKQEFTNDSWLFGNIPLFVTLGTANYGTSIGLANSPNEPTREYSRMLTHLIVEPIRKPANRTYIIRYSLSILAAE
jgi:hypothetical protein